MFRPELVCLKVHASAECAANDAFKHVPEMVIECMNARSPQNEVERLEALNSGAA